MEYITILVGNKIVDPLLEGLWLRQKPLPPFVKNKWREKEKGERIGFQLFEKASGLNDWIVLFLQLGSGPPTPLSSFRCKNMILRSM